MSIISKLLLGFVQLWRSETTGRQAKAPAPLRRQHPPRRGAKSWEQMADRDELKPALPVLF